MNSQLRPIGARALKSAIDTLRPYLFESEVLDLYAGQGRFGISAAEEGASSAVFVEKHRATLADIKNETLHPTFPKDISLQLHCEDTLAYLEKAHSKGLSFSIIFADPPFEYWVLGFQEKLFNAVVKVMKEDSIFLVKHPKAVLPSSPTPELHEWKSVNFGESSLQYFRYAKGNQNKI